MQWQQTNRTAIQWQVAKRLVIICSLLVIYSPGAGCSSLMKLWSWFFFQKDTIHAVMQQEFLLYHWPGHQTKYRSIVQMTQPCQANFWRQVLGSCENYRCHIHSCTIVYKSMANHIFSCFTNLLHCLSKGPVRSMTSYDWSSLELLKETRKIQEN